jgi:hypothetical protein
MWSSLGVLHPGLRKVTTSKRQPTTTISCLITASSLPLPETYYSYYARAHFVWPSGTKDLGVPHGICSHFLSCPSANSRGACCSYELSVVGVPVDDFESYLQTWRDATNTAGVRKAHARVTGEARFIPRSLRGPLWIAPHCDEPDRARKESPEPTNPRHHLQGLRYHGKRFAAGY